MQELSQEIRVYRVMFADGRSVYEQKESDSRGGEAVISVRGAAIVAQETVARMHHEGHLSVGIDFTSFHQIDCPNGLTPRRCYPLTAEEQDEFCKSFMER